MKRQRNRHTSPAPCSLCGGVGKYIEHMGPMKQLHYCHCEEGQRKRERDARGGKLCCRCRFCDTANTPVDRREASGPTGGSDK